MRGHGAKDIGQQDLLRARLDAQIDMNEPLVRLSQVIRWEYLVGSEQRLGKMS